MTKQIPLLRLLLAFACCALGVTTHCAGQDITSNLVGHWKLDESSGSSVADSSGYGNGGTVSGSTNWTSGHIAGGHRFYYPNGDDYVEITNSGSLQDVQEGNYTLAGWFNPKSVPPGTSDNDNTAAYGILIKQGFHLGLFYNRYQQFEFTHWTTGDNWQGVGTWSDSYSTDTFHHVVGVVNRSAGTVKIYVDGEHKDTNTFTGGTSAREYGPVPWRIGISGPGLSNWRWAADGVADDVRIYARALSDADISALYMDGWATKKLLLVHENSSLTSQETLRRDKFMEWGFAVTTIRDTESQATYDAALADIDVVYVPEEILSGDVNHKLREATVGVLVEESQLHDETGISTNGGSETTGTSVSITSNAHYITSVFPTGSLTIASSSQPLIRTNSTRAADLEVLGQISGVAALGVINTGGALANTYNGANVAFGRRVVLPFGGNSFDFSSLNANGLTLLERAIEWAAGDDGLVAHWKFDEGGGSTIDDATGNGHGASFNTGSPNWVSGVRIGALEFNGSNDAATDGSFDPPDTGTVAFWMKRDGPASGTQRLFGLGGDWEARMGSSGIVVFDLAGEGGGSFETATALDMPGRWYHVAAIYNCDDDTYSVYVNGELETSGTKSLSPQSANTLSLGTRTGSSERFDGALDDFRIYNRELSASEVAELYGLVGHWKLEESNGSVAADSSGIDNDGNFWSGAAPGGDGPYPGAGATAAQFDGSSAHVGMDPVAAYDNITETISVSAWVLFNTAVADQSQQEFLFGRDNWSDKTGFLLLADQPYSDSLIFRVYDGTTNFDAAWTNSGIEAGEWHHVVGTCDGSSVKLYVDGELKASTSFAGSLVPATGNLNIGYQQDGRMFDVRLYNRAIFESEIAEIYGMVGWWKLDETSGTTAVDSSLAGQDGSYAGGATLGESGPIATTAAALFDGVNDHVVLPSYSTDFTGGYSMAVWARPSNVKNWARFLELGDGAGNHNLLFARESTTANLVANIHGGSLGYQSMQAGDAIVNDVWYHYAVTVDSNGLGTLYVNGVPVESDTLGVPGDTLRRENYIARSNWSGDDYFHGKMFDVRLFNRPMSVEEIQSAYGSGVFQGVRIIKWVEVQ